MKRRHCDVEHVSETACEVSFDAKQNCILLSGQSEDVQQAETRLRTQCLAALCHDTLTVNQPGITSRFND